MDFKNTINQLIKNIQKDSTVKHSKEVYLKLRRGKAIQAFELAGSIFFIFNDEKEFLKFDLEDLFSRNLGFIEAVLNPADPLVGEKHFLKLKKLEAIESLKKMLARNFKPSLNVVDKDTTSDFIVDLLALSIFYFLPGKISPVVELRMDAFLCKYIEAAKSFIVSSKLKALPETKRIKKSIKSKKGKMSEKQRIIGEAYFKREEEKPGWAFDKTRTQRARYLEKNTQIVYGHKSIMNFLKWLEQEDVKDG